MVDSVLAADQHYDRNDVEIVKCEPCFKGFFRINRYHLRHKLFAGGWGDVIQREMFERGHAAAVLLYDIENHIVRFSWAGLMALQEAPHA